MSDDSSVLEATLLELTARFLHVFFVPGNHEVWVKRSASTPAVDSYAKLRDVLALCARLGVHTTPRVVGGTDAGDADAKKTTPVLVVPLLSWHHASFDSEPELSFLEVPPARRVMTDYHACTWPAGVDDAGDDVARLWDGMNDEAWRAAGFDADAAARRAMAPHVVTASHFLPRLELCPEKRFLFFPNLPKSVGSTFLGARVARLRPDVHVFGHTHFSYDITLDDGVRYVQAALAYPKERQSRMSTLRIGGVQSDESLAPVFLYDSAGEGSFAPRYACRWSDYYAANARQPRSREVPEWVAKRYRRKAEAAV